MLTFCRSGPDTGHNMSLRKIKKFKHTWSGALRFPNVFMTNVVFRTVLHVISEEMRNSQLLEFMWSTTTVCTVSVLVWKRLANFWSNNASATIYQKNAQGAEAKLDGGTQNEGNLTSSGWLEKQCLLVSCNYGRWQNQLSDLNRGT